MSWLITYTRKYSKAFQRISYHSSATRLTCLMNMCLLHPPTHFYFRCSLSGSKPEASTTPPREPAEPPVAREPQAAPEAAAGRGGRDKAAPLARAPPFLAGCITLPTTRLPTILAPPAPRGSRGKGRRARPCREYPPPEECLPGLYRGWCGGGMSA